MSFGEWCAVVALSIVGAVGAGLYIAFMAALFIGSILFSMVYALRWPIVIVAGLIIVARAIP